MQLILHNISTANNVLTNYANLVEDHENSFKKLYENNTTKITIICVSVLFSIIVVTLSYGIIWYEKFGSDKKRTLINKLVASLCWNEIAFFSTVQILYVVRFYFGPLPPFLCFWMFVIRKTIIINGIFTLNSMSLVRFIFIFWLKKPAGINAINFFC